MSLLHPRSLKWRLVTRIATIQGALFATLVLGMMVVLGILWMRGTIDNGNFEFSTIRALTDSLARDADGRLIVRANADLKRLRNEIPNFWFVARDDEGHEVSEGRVPDEVRPLIADLHLLENARIRSSRGDAALPLAVMQKIPTAVGPVRMLTSAQGSVQFWQLIENFAPMLGLTVAIVGLMTLATILVTPLSVRRALSGLELSAEEARHIDINRSGARLTTGEVPSEIIPLVAAVNDALARLDKGYESHKRFLADAAHELRTPVAILTTRISALAPGPEKTRLLEDTTRLTVLTGQLLDLQRLDQQQARFEPVDLVAVAERAVLDLAPLAFAAGYEMTFDPEAPHVTVQGDEMALDRALTNLIQNAIDHGGRRGIIMVRVAAAGWMEVCDEGAGIPPDRREQVFEPFHRLRQGGSGAGLGLDLVQRIMRMHGGRAEVAAGPSMGACMRLVFPMKGLALRTTDAG